MHPSRDNLNVFVSLAFMLDPSVEEMLFWSV